MKFSWDDLGELGKRVADTLYDAADTVGKKTGEVVEVQKLKNQIYAMRRENAKDCLDIGRMVFAKYQGGGEVDEDYKELCQEMEAREKEILSLEKKVAEKKGTEFCKNCHAPVENGMKYCPFCGEKLDEDIEDEDEDIDDVEDIFEVEDISEAIFEKEAETAAVETILREENDEAEREFAEENGIEEIFEEEDLADYVAELEGKEGDV